MKKQKIYKRLRKPRFPKRHDVSEVDCQFCKKWLNELDDWRQAKLNSRKKRL